MARAVHAARKGISMTDYIDDLYRLLVLRGYSQLDAFYISSMEPPRSSPEPRGEPVAHVRYARTGGNVGIAWHAVPTGTVLPEDGAALFVNPPEPRGDDGARLWIANPDATCKVRPSEPRCEHGSGQDCKDCYNQRHSEPRGIPVAQVVADDEALPFRKAAWLGKDLPVGAMLYAAPTEPPALRCRCIGGRSVHVTGIEVPREKVMYLEVPPSFDVIIGTEWELRPCSPTTKADSP
jgi:hypothetical protein